ncbi:hypothetical protein C8F01DRAFT_1270061 [Mycena amicta]|nr:hypothetical protein C8F01DRAFT_1270061 [Mycena amicta]
MLPTPAQASFAVLGGRASLVGAAHHWHWNSAQAALLWNRLPSLALVLPGEEEDVLDAVGQAHRASEELCATLPLIRTFLIRTFLSAAPPSCARQCPRPANPRRRRSRWFEYVPPVVSVHLCLTETFSQVADGRGGNPVMTDLETTPVKMFAPVPDCQYHAGRSYRMG